MAVSRVKKRNVSLALTVEQYRQVRQLHERTRVPMQVYLREAVDDLLAKYKKEVSR